MQIFQNILCNNFQINYLNHLHQNLKLFACFFLSVQLLKLILGDFDGIDANFVFNLKLQTLEQLTNILVYALMTTAGSDETEQTLLLESGTVNRVLQSVCKIIAHNKSTFIPWPSKHEIERSVKRFDRFHEYGQYEFYNVFGAIGTVEFHVKPALPDYLNIPETAENASYTPIKWQCSCDVSGFLQSSFVVVPKKDLETKNSYVFEMNPVQTRLEAMKTDEVYLVADETLTLVSYLLTPHEKIIIHSDQHNKALESKRKVIDKTFEKILSRFRILDRIELSDENSIRDIIDTVGILHNFFVVHNDELYLND